MSTSENPFSPDIDEQRTPPSAWRFTLREILISMVALGAVLALIANSGPFFASTPTSFFHAIETRDVLKTICQRRGLKLDMPSSGHGASYGGTTAVRRLNATVRSPSPGESGRVLWELQRDIEELLNKHGCKIGNRMTSGNPGRKTLVDFAFGYTKGNSHGDVQVYSLSGAGDHWRLLIVLHEFAR